MFLLPVCIYSDAATNNSGLSLFILLIKSFDRADYYRLRQWTIQSVVMDCIVCRSSVLLQRTVIIFRLKELSRQ